MEEDAVVVEDAAEDAVEEQTETRVAPVDPVEDTEVLPVEDPPEDGVSAVEEVTEEVPPGCLVDLVSLLPRTVEEEEEEDPTEDLLGTRNRIAPQ